MRTITILKVGETKDGRVWIRGVVDFTPDEQMAAMKIAMGLATEPPNAAFGMVNGLPDAAASKLNVGDRIAAETVTVTVSRGEPYEDANGVTKVGVDSRIRVSGKCTRSAAPTAECDW